jgi:hypothetical protein
MKLGLSPLFCSIPQVGMVENKGVTQNLAGFIENCRCFKERWLKIPALGRTMNVMSHAVDDVVGDVGTCAEWAAGRGERGYVVADWISQCA